jgi:hypothetical protein
METTEYLLRDLHHAQAFQSNSTATNSIRKKQLFHFAKNEYVAALQNLVSQLLISNPAKSTCVSDFLLPPPRKAVSNRGRPLKELTVPERPNTRRSRRTLAPPKNIEYFIDSTHDEDVITCISCYNLILKVGMGNNLARKL